MTRREVALLAAGGLLLAAALLLYQLPYPVRLPVLASIAGLVWLAFVVTYATLTSGAWRKTRHGRNVMTLGICLTVMIATTVASMIGLLSIEWGILSADILWPALAAVGAHRLALLWRDQHPHPANPKED